MGFSSVYKINFNMLKRIKLAETDNNEREKMAMLGRLG